MSSTLRRFQSPVLICLLLSLWGCGATPETYVERGKRFLAAGKLDDATIQFQKAIQKSPKPGEAHYQLGLIDLQRGRTVDGYRELQAADASMPGNRDVMAKLGQVALGLYNSDPRHPQQLYDQATVAITKLLGVNPRDYDGNLLQGALFMTEKRPADAVESLRKAIQADPKKPDAKLGLARALIQDGQAAQAVEVARDLVQKNKTFGPGYDLLFEQYQASGKAQEAEAILKLKVSNNPKQASSILELARYYAVTRRPAEMTSTLARMLDNPADFPDGKLAVGDFYASAGLPDEAVRQYEKALAQNPKNQSLYRKRMVRVLASQHKWPAAEEQLKAILKSEPADGEAKLVRALVWLDEGKPENLDAAVTELHAQLAKRPDDATLHFQLGNALVRKSDVDGAKREWLIAAKSNAAFLPPRFALVQADLAQGKAQEALPIAQEIVAAAPRDAEAHLLRATCLTEAGQLQQARAELNQLSAQFPKNPQVRYRLGMLALAEHKYPEAEAEFRRIEGPAAADAEVAAGIAQAYMGQNQSPKAIQLLQDQLKRHPADARIRQLLARSAMGSRNVDLAIEQYQQLLAASPNSLSVQLSLAAAYNAKGQPGAAIGILNKTVQANPKSVPANLQLAQSFALAGRVDESKAAYRKVIALDPNNANALNDLAYLMADSGENLDEAFSLAQRGQQNAVDANLKASVSDTLGWIYLKKKMDDSALQTFQILVKQNPRNSTFLYHLGATLYDKGDKKSARVQLEAALAAKPGAADEPKIRELLARL